MIIEVQNLRKTFWVREKQAGLRSGFKRLFSSKGREVSAVDDISFSVDRGEIVAFIGPNGAGKSTTIKIMTGILSRTSGNVSILGMDPGQERLKLAFKIGAVFGQKAQLWFHLPAIDSFKLFGQMYEIERDQFEQRLRLLVEAFEIERFLNVPVRKLSLGERMRCEIVASLLHGPQIVFLDEPTIGLDVVAKQHIRSVIKQINESEQVTIFLTSHDAGDIEALAKRTVLINHGQIVYDGSTAMFGRDYLKTKTVEIILEEEAERFNPDEGKIVERGKFNLKIEVENNGRALERLLSYATSKFKLADINIFEPELEEVIAKIYRQKTRETVAV